MRDGERVAPDSQAERSTLARNVGANIGGRFWVALMSFAFVPFYLDILGIEAYALVGVFASILAIFAILDLGLGLTVNRELARRSAVDGSLPGSRSLLRTFEIIYWTIGVAIGAVVVAAAPWIATRWLRLHMLSVDQATTAIRLMGVTTVLRWPVSLYSGALSGLQAQVLQNGIAMAAATISGAGALLVLRLMAPTITAFFTWSVVVAALQIVLMRWATWRRLALKGHQPVISFAPLRATIGFSAGIAGITLLSIVLTQLDKVILSRILPLREFGYYALATAIAAMLQVAGSAVESATFPVLARLHAAGQYDELSAVYHRASQALAVLVIPVAATLAAFSPELLTAYTGNPETAAHTHLVLSLLVTGNAILAMMFMPLSLQLASGWTKLSLYKNVVAAILFVPALTVMVQRYGAPGAATVWIILTVGYFIVEVQVMHRRLLPGEQWRWYAADIGAPLAVSLVVVGAMRLVVGPERPLLLNIGLIALAAAIALVGSALASPLRREIHAHWRRRRHGLAL